MTYTAKFDLIRQQRAYSRRIAAVGLPALLAPYTRRPAPVVPAQRRRFVRTEVAV